MKDLIWEHPTSGARWYYETITPKRAQELLDSNYNANQECLNRPMKNAALDLLSREIDDGTFIADNPVNPIIIGSDGRLKDGQHRCTTIVRAGITVQNLVIENLPGAYEKLIDANYERSYPDRARLRGDLELTKKEVSACYMVETGQLFSKRAASDDDLKDIISQHIEAVRWVMKRFPTGTYPQQAALARAYEQEDESTYERLEEFCMVLESGYVKGVKNYLPALSMRELMTDPKDKLTVKHVNRRQHMFRNMMLAVRNFIQDANVSVELEDFDKSLTDLEEIYSE